MNGIIPPTICDEMRTCQVFHCSNGHLICSECRPRVPGDACACCREPYTGRATAVEKMIDQLVRLNIN